MTFTIRHEIVYEHMALLLRRIYVIGTSRSMLLIRDVDYDINIDTDINIDIDKDLAYIKLTMCQGQFSDL